MAEKEVSVGAIVYRKQSGAELRVSSKIKDFRREKNKILYLLLYRKAHEHYREAWNFPRGLIESGESKEKTARREIKEETGIEKLEFKEGFEEKIHFFYRRDGINVSKDVFYMLAETKTKDVKISFEHDDFAWLPFEDAMGKLTFKNDKEVLRNANTYLTGASLEVYA